MNRNSVHCNNPRGCNQRLKYTHVPVASVLGKAIVVYLVAPIALVILFIELCLKFSCTDCKEVSVAVEQLFPFA